jgi:methyl-accepting chemotaxis protein
MKIKKKFTLEIIILSIILAITSFIIIDNTLNVEEHFSILNDELIPRLSLLKDMRLMASNVLISTLEFTMFEENFVMSENTGSNTNIQSSEILSQIEENKIQFTQLFEMYKQHLSDTFVEDSVHKINLKWEQFTILSDKFVDYRKRGISGDEFMKIKNDFKNSKDNLFAEIDSLLIINEKQVEKKGHDVSELVKFSTILILIVVSVFVLVLIILRHYLLKSILRPIFQIRSATQEIAQNKLNLRIDDISKDEIGELSEDINLMTHKLETVQDKLLKSEKLSVVGVLAGRMAHDIRNPLAIIMASLEILKLKYPDIEDVKFNKINNAVNRITHQIKMSWIL